MNLLKLRFKAREIFDEALRAVDAGAAVRNAIRVEGARLQVGDFATDNDRIYSIAVGKAAFAMGSALQQVLGKSLAGGVLVGPDNPLADDQESLLRERWYRIEGGHPLPNKRSLYAAERVFEVLDQANNEHALVIFLISGGGSAMMESPISHEITLQDLCSANQALVNSGASIGEINSVRRAFSGVKGGRLAASARNCVQVTLIVSDVPKGQEHDVASGPTLSPPVDAPFAADVVARYGLRDELPLSIMRAIEAATAEPPKARHNPHFVLIDNNTALEAAATAARTRGFVAEIAHEISDDQIDAGCKNLLTRFGELQRSDAAVCLISGGEFSCPVRGEGLGGRNLETALRLAVAAEQNRDQVGEFVALCAGTDGIDGNSPAAGAIIDSTTIARARRIGLDPNDFLQRSDSYSFFVALGDAITTGPTGTNVRDVRILLAGRM